ncbi:hypothetical protein SAMN05192549_104457 [Duganella sacchari]|uniref:Uncharacterized protein n=1 Tax=Duganella sacchari TaxID=551987 RepID=A0A1M7P6S7_9BURK|nr:hypothetical protein SAMN05192549_104457 [Duganella sacchari]
MVSGELINFAPTIYVKKKGELLATPFSLQPIRND